MLASKLRYFAKSRTSTSVTFLTTLTVPLRTAMTEATQTGVASTTTSTDAWPIAVHNINKNLVSAQYAGGYFRR